MQKWIWSPILCKLGPAARSLNVTVSIFTLVALSIDRSYVILYPFKQKLKKMHCLIIIIFIWLVGLSMGVYTFFNYELDSIRSNDVVTMICSYADNTLTKYYLSTLTLIQFVIPFFVFTYTYLIVWYEFRFRKSNDKLENNLSMNRIEKSKENRNKV